MLKLAHDCGECVSMMSSNLLCSSLLYAVPDQSVTASGDLLKGLLRNHGARSAPRVAPSTGPGVGLFSVFQTIWISNRDSACESVRQFDPARPRSVCVFWALVFQFWKVYKNGHFDST